MTYNEIINIANRLDKETKQEIDKAVEERLEILKEGELSKEDLEKMEECLYMTLVIQEYLNGEFELLEEEKVLLLEEMEEMYNQYGELLLKAKLEEKLSKKKRMTLELMRIREELLKRKKRIKDVNDRMKENLENQEKFQELSTKEKMEEIAQENKNKIDKEKEPSSGYDNDIEIDNTIVNDTLDTQDSTPQKEEMNPTEDKLQQEAQQRERDKLDAYESLDQEMNFDPIGEFEDAIENVAAPDDIYNLYGNEASNAIDQNGIEEILKKNGQNR